MARNSRYLTSPAEKGYFGVFIFNCKDWINVAGIWRSTQILGGSLIGTIGARYKKSGADVLDSSKHIPMFEYDSFEQFYKNLPKDCILVGVELCEQAELLDTFAHPERAIYLLGAENHGLPLSILNKCHKIVKLSGSRSLNVAVAGSITIYHRNSQRNNFTSF